MTILRCPTARSPVGPALLCAYLVLAFATDAFAQTRVGSAAELMAALSKAKPNERIELAPGHYGTLALNGKNQSWARFAAPVTIASADEAKPAEFGGINLRFVRNLTVSGVRLKYVFAAGDTVRAKPTTIWDSEDVRIRASAFEGDVARGVGEAMDGFATGIGLDVTRSRNIEIESNRFHTWHRAAVVAYSEHVTIRGNEVKDIRSDGFNFARVNDVLIENNHLHDFRTSLSTGDHPDMIQFWTNGTREPTFNIQIKNNYLDSGAGPWTQSIFVRNEEVDHRRGGREMFYRNFEITGNLIRNSHLHGISIGQVDGLVIGNNTLIQAAPSPRLNHVTVPAINVNATSENVRIHDNIAPRFPTPIAGWAFSNNVSVQRNFVRQKDFYTNVFVDALAPGSISADKLQILPGSAVAALAVGSHLSKFDERPRQPRVVIQSQATSAARLAEQKFEVAAAYGPQGKLDLGGATVKWTLDWDTTADGLAVSHRFAEAGLHRISVEVTLRDGTRIEGERTIQVE